MQYSEILQQEQLINTSLVHILETKYQWKTHGFWEPHPNLAFKSAINDSSSVILK